MNLFSDCLDRLKPTLRVSKDQEVAAALGLSKTAFSERKKRGSFPDRELRALAQQRPDLKIDVDYVLTGRASTMAIGTRNQVGARLRNARLRARCSDVSLAAHLGCSLADYAALEDGLRSPTPAEVNALHQHPDIDATLVLSGYSLQRLEWDLDEGEQLLMRHYRTCTAADQEVIRHQAEFLASRTTGQRNQSDIYTTDEPNTTAYTVHDGGARNRYDCPVPQK